MRLDSYISRARIVDIKSKDVPGAFKELLNTFTFNKQRPEIAEKIISELMEREKTITSYLGEGISLPHTRSEIVKKYTLAIGRCPEGLKPFEKNNYDDVRFIFLLIAPNKARHYLNCLATLARCFQNNDDMSALRAADDLPSFKVAVQNLFYKETSKPSRQSTRFNKLILREAEKIAKGAQCSSILIFEDTFAGGVEPEVNIKGFNAVFITQSFSRANTSNNSNHKMLSVRAFNNNRLSQLKSAVLIGLTRSIFKSNERICCIGGIPQSNQFDSIVIIDIEREFSSIIRGNTSSILPPGVRAEVLERVIAVATELAYQGREGKPVGSLFVLGDSEKVKGYVKPLILNPFYGYKEEDRNILNPFMDETVKELAGIDGAFIISGNGVLESAGSLVHAPDYTHNIPSGYGTRHAAAAAISIATNCISIVVSSSTSQVSIFRGGEMLPLLDKNTASIF
jgi:DNA integrity scanning protein DisA with diadenylate cyclase activity/mannitol/fructose-specific phosphotransferase system IIA component (Ntr-type)